MFDTLDSATPKMAALACPVKVSQSAAENFGSMVR